MFQQVTIAELYWFDLFLKGYPLEAKATPLYWFESDFGIIIQTGFLFVEQLKRLYLPQLIHW